MAERGMIYFLIPLALLLGLMAMSCSAQHRQEPRQVEGRLAPCPKRPNCVCSEDQGQPFWIQPLLFKGEPEASWAKLRQAVLGMGGRIEGEDGFYLWATFRSKLFRFVDDVQFRMDLSNQIIHVRSASRTGYSDFGVNRKRVEAIRSVFSKGFGQKSVQSGK